MELKLQEIQKPDEMNFILGMSHFIKTVEDIHEAIVQTCPSIKFGLAFCEASGPCLIRITGNDSRLKEIAKKNAENIAAGHTFIIFLENGFPINILNAIKTVPEVCQIFCATSNPTKIIVAEDDNGRGVLGVIDGYKPKGVETEADIDKRQKFLRMIGYKLG
ncbi:adenosine-specific kinase [bacterium]|nr:adenosine-specific kinase [candidate division CSSED10-310 bacterium]